MSAPQLVCRLNHTHDAQRRSWVESANAPGCDFPLQNLPFGVFHPAGEALRIGVAIGDQVLDLAACFHAGLFRETPVEAGNACAQPELNALMALGQQHWSALRSRLFDLLAEDASEREQVRPCLVPMAEAVMDLPCRIGDYTDFYASIDHATNVGRMFRPDNPLLPNYKYLPVGYHGRSSSIVVSGTGVVRPHGQIKPATDEPPIFTATRELDYELELGFLVGQGNPPGERVALADAHQHIFGVCLLNDWSARDIQAWEYQPLGPFLAKSFATTISPWIVTMEALAPFRVAAASRPAEDPALLPHLYAEQDREHGGLDVQLEVHLTSDKMRKEGGRPHRLSRGNFSRMYWTPAQMLTHHASNGCNLRAGDLLGSGTASGPEKESRGCLLEIAERRREPITLPNGEQRSFLSDGDEVLLTGRCEREGFVGLGFGQCAGRILPAR